MRTVYDHVVRAIVLGLLLAAAAACRPAPPAEKIPALPERSPRLHPRIPGAEIPGSAAALLERIEERIRTAKSLRVRADDGGGRTTVLMKSSDRVHLSTGEYWIICDGVRAVIESKGLRYRDFKIDKGASEDVAAVFTRWPSTFFMFIAINCEGVYIDTEGGFYNAFRVSDVAFAGEGGDAIAYTVTISSWWGDKTASQVTLRVDPRSLRLLRRRVEDDRDGRTDVEECVYEEFEYDAEIPDREFAVPPEKFFEDK